MAVQHGYKGSVYLKTGSNVYTKVLNTTNWNLNYINEIAEARIHEETHVKRFTGMRDWNGSAEALMAGTRVDNLLVTKLISNNSTLAPGTTFIRLRLNSGSTAVLQGSCVITDVAIGAPADGLPTVTFNYAADGAMNFVYI